MTCWKIVKVLVAGVLCAGHDPTSIPTGREPARDRPSKPERHGPGRLRQLWNTLTGHRLGGTVILAALGLCFFSVTRLILMVMGRDEAELGGLGGAGILFSGLLNDLVVSVYATLPLTVWLAVIPQRLFARRGHRRAMSGIILLSLFTLLFLMLAEGVFWGEFATRFNFIAIDYLIYTTEVLTNIWESYPVFWLLAVIFAAAAMLAWGMHRGGVLMPWQNSSTGWKTRWSAAAAQVLAVVILAFTFDNQTAIPP